MGSGNKTSSNVMMTTCGKGLHVFFISNSVTDFRMLVGELLSTFWMAGNFCAIACTDLAVEREMGKIIRHILCFVLYFLGAVAKNRII
jgi:hypothetical protein